jgi:hypothetical protein
MLEFDEETLRELDEEAKSLRNQMKSKHSAKIKTLSLLVSQLPKNHPDLVEFQQEWKEERDKDKAKLEQIERMTVSHHLSRFSLRCKVILIAN